MNLGIMLSPGDGLTKLARFGQDKRFVNLYLKTYLKYFKKVYIFSYLDEKYSLPPRCILVTNNKNMHRYLYTFLLVVQHNNKIKDCDVIRVLQLPGIIPAIFAKVFAKKPILTTYGYKYSEFAEIEHKILVAKSLKILEVVTLRLVDGLIVTTLSLKSYVAKLIPKKKVFLIPNGVNVRMFKPAKKELDYKNIQLISVGRLEIQKNYENLIIAISRSKFFNQLQLTLVGKGSLKNRLTKLALKLNVNLKLIDVVPYDKLPKLLGKQDIFILPSLTEGHPKTLIEALSAGLPCIGANVEGINKLIKDKKTGLLCETDSESIQKCIDELIIDKKIRREVSVNGRKMVENNFDIEKLLAKEITIMKSLTFKTNKNE